MNPVERIARRVDAFQQGHTPLAFVFAVMKKYGDDNAGALVSYLAYTAFAAIFPLLLLLVTVLGLVLGASSRARNAVLHSTLSQFPVIGNQLGHQIHAMQKGSVPALIISLAFLIWGSTGLAQAGLFAMGQVWNLPGPERPNYVKRLGRSFGFLAIMGAGLVVTTAAASFGTWGGGHGLGLRVASEIVAALINVGQYFLAFRVLTPKAVETRRLFPGAVFGGLAWTVMQAVGGYLVDHDLRNDSVYGVFGVVLGLLAWVYIGVEISVYAAELNTVLARRLWPRGMVQPPLTKADQESMALQALQNQRRPEQKVDVTYTEEPMTQEEYARTRS